MTATLLDFMVAGLAAGIGISIGWNVTGWIQKWRER